MKDYATLPELLSPNPYPGRGIGVGITADGKTGVLVYFIMGRSANSRNRVFVEEGKGIRTEAFDPSKMEDPSLIIYSPVRVLGDTTIVTNGDQTDTIYEGLEKGLSFEQSLRSRKFEPDGPNFTPRISAVFEQGEKPEYSLSILKSDEGDPGSVLRQTFQYETPLPGVGKFLHTYRENGDPLPSFGGEPENFRLETADIDAFTKEVWEALDRDNKISLFVRFISLGSGEAKTRIINRNSDQLPSSSMA